MITINVVMKNIYLVHLSCIVAFAIFVCSCAPNDPDGKKNVAKNDTAKLSDTAALSGRKRNSYKVSDPDIQFVAKQIDTKVFTAPLSIHGNRFAPVTALRQLYPGNYYSFIDSFFVENDSVSLTAWMCDGCPKQPFKGWWGEDHEAFPYDAGNLTQYIDTLLYTDEDGQQNEIISFSTLQLQDEGAMYCGRTACAYLGLAWFTRENDAKQLRSFAPVLGCFGAFQGLPEIHLLKFGKNNYGCYLLNSNGGAGGPYYTELHVFGLVNGRFKSVLSIDNVERSNTGLSDWNMYINMESKNTDSSFNNILLTMAGKCAKISFDEYSETLTEAPMEIRKLAEKKDSFSFKIVRDYGYEKGAYRPKTSELVRPKQK